MECLAGMKVWVHKKEKREVRRKGYVVAVHDRFVCVWMAGRADENVGWRECFFYDDIANGNVEITLRTTVGRIYSNRFMQGLAVTVSGVI
ncbi:hypothetical protein [Zhaonella formicivorans]|uniref:hypothetical protein n=1 Tax=Zhaonella formicivorans TaxID=2528593 RepID=UPI0010DF58BA|nr:hypothetical protein [Zhaonella formicivorans]